MNTFRMKLSFLLQHFIEGFWNLVDLLIEDKLGIAFGICLIVSLSWLVGVVGVVVGVFGFVLYTILRVGGI